MAWLNGEQKVHEEETHTATKQVQRNIRHSTKCNTESPSKHQLSSSVRSPQAKHVSSEKTSKAATTTKADFLKKLRYFENGNDGVSVSVTKNGNISLTEFNRNTVKGRTDTAVVHRSTITFPISNNTETISTQARRTLPQNGLYSKIHHFEKVSTTTSSDDALVPSSNCVQNFYFGASSDITLNPRASIETNKNFSIVLKNQLHTNKFLSLESFNRSVNEPSRCSSDYDLDINSRTMQLFDRSYYYVLDSDASDSEFY